VWKLPAVIVLALASILVFQSPLSNDRAAGADPDMVEITQHVRLGFDAEFDFGDSRGDVIEGLFGEDLISYNFGIDGTANITADMGADITLRYDRANVVPGGTVPVEIVYTPTNDFGDEITLGGTGTLTADVDVTAAGFAELCTIFPPICPVLITLDTIDEEVDGFTLGAGSADFAAPLAGDAPVVVPATGDSLVMSFLGIEFVSATLESSLTLSPSPPAPGDFPGLGGAAAVMAVTGADMTGIDNPVNDSPSFPAGDADVGILEWNAAGDGATATIQLPADPTVDVNMALQPVLHWLATSANLDLDLDLIGPLGLFDDPSDIELFSGSLAPVYVQAGLDTSISDAVSAALGGLPDPGVGAEVAAGNIPVPALVPQPPGALPGVPPIPDFATFLFSIDPDSDDDGLLDGEEIALGTDPDDADTDDDGLTDGEEVLVYFTDPLDPDTDDDDLTDGEEVNTYGTDPLDPDTDDDDCLDGFEVNVIGTDPLDPDTDDDGLTDCLELDVGTDPLDPDTDDDGIPDGQDSEFVQNIVNGLPDSAFKGNGHRTAILAQLDNVEHQVAMGHIDVALKMLHNLRKHVDGCGAVADNNDWIIDCAAQTEVRELIDLLMANLS
jgi:hypothetical protein